MEINEGVRSLQGNANSLHGGFNLGRQTGERSVMAANTRSEKSRKKGILPRAVWIHQWATDPTRCVNFLMQPEVKNVN